MQCFHKEGIPCFSHFFNGHGAHGWFSLVIGDHGRIPLNTSLMRIMQWREQRQRLVSAIVLSWVDYCNVALARLPASSLAPLQRVLNAAARFVADPHPRDHVTATLGDLHWLPIKTRITYQLCTLMHASVYGAAPVYIRKMLTSVTELPGRSHLRSAASGLYDVM